MKESSNLGKHYNCAEKHPFWKGGRTIDKSGYVLIHVGRRKYIREHRLVVEKKIGRKLLPTESVHHINGVKHDNRLENLELFSSNGRHLAHELKGKCPKWSEDGKLRIKQGIRAWLDAGNRSVRRDYDKDELIFYYAECGWTTQMVATKIQTNSETVSRLLKSYGIEVLDRSVWTRLTPVGVLKLKENPRVLEVYARRTPLDGSRLRGLCDRVGHSLSQKEYVLLLQQVFPQSKRVHEMARVFDPALGPYRPQGRKS